MIKPQTLKGFRDFLPEEALKRQEVITRMKTVFAQFGFDPLETPALEYAETLIGKYGDEADKLLYLFEDNGGRKVGLRYDQTVPFSRVIAQYPDRLAFPFKRYQIQPVWRAENTQKGRFREFLQCDIDIVGTENPMADAEIILCAMAVAKALGLPQPIMLVNDRMIFDALGLSKKEIIIVDKLEKIGKDAVTDELTKLGRSDAEETLEHLKESLPTERLMAIFTALKAAGLREEVDFRLDRFLARGLDYYTSTIFELKVPSYPTGSLAGGGRYDELIGSFVGKSVPAVGLAFGFDRLADALEEAKLLSQRKTTTSVLVTLFDETVVSASSSLTAALREHGIATEMTLDTSAKLEKQLKYADKKGIPYVLIQGPEEAARNVVKLKTMETKEQEEMTIEAVIDKLTKAE